MTPLYPDGNKIRFQAAVGARIREARLAYGVTGPTLAAHARVSVSTLQKIESGESACPLWVLSRFADRLDVTLDELVPVLTDGAA